MKSQGDSSFPTDGHKAILNKLNCKSKTNIKTESGWTLTIRINHNSSIELKRSEINYCGLKPVLCSTLNPFKILRALSPTHTEGNTYGNISMHTSMLTLTHAERGRYRRADRERERGGREGERMKGERHSDSVFEFTFHLVNKNVCKSESC